MTTGREGEQRECICFESRTSSMQECPAHANPFYNNYVFREFDRSRCIIDWTDKLWLWLWPTYVQLNDGYIFKYKNVHGSIYLMSVEEFSSGGAR